MGSTEHVHVTAPDGQFVLIIPVVDLEAKGALKAGDPIWFKFEKNATHLFDKVSGKNLIRPAGTSRPFLWATAVLPSFLPRSNRGSPPVHWARGAFLCVGIV